MTSGFDPNQVYIRVAKDGDESVGEGALKVILDFPVKSIADPWYAHIVELWTVADYFWRMSGLPDPNPYPEPTYSFRVTSKNCDLVISDDFFNAAPPNPYDSTAVDATLHTGSGALTATFQNTFDASGSGSTTTEPILQSVNSFGLLQCANAVVPSPFLDPTEPQYQQAGSLVSPFFYKDLSDVSTTDEMTFYVQPSLTETTVTEWTGWAISIPIISPVLSSGEIFNRLPVNAQVPTAGPNQVLVADQTHSLYAMQPTTDWLTAPATTLSYNGTLIGQSGGINATTQPAVAAAPPPVFTNPVPLATPRVSAAGRPRLPEKQPPATVQRLRKK